MAATYEKYRNYSDSEISESLSKSIRAQTDLITGNGVLVFAADPDETFDDSGTTYCRIMVLKHNGDANGYIYMTFDKQIWVNGKGSYPIHRSTDGGFTWEHISSVQDDWYGTIRTSNPTLFELPKAVGDMPEGTLLLAGILSPLDQSFSQMTMFKSTDLGFTWEPVSIVDTGGPMIYDPTPESTTTTIWEPFLAMDGNDNLTCYYSDERQKDRGILQALVKRSTTDGVNWGELSNVVGVPNWSDRPGMITVTELPNGRHLAAYEVVNRPSQQLDTAIGYYKFSEDGVNWDSEDLGQPVVLRDGTFASSAPYVKWVDAGGPNGMVVFHGKWQNDANGYIAGSGCLAVNYNLGEGPWERLPMALDFDGPNLLGLLSGFSGSVDISPDGKWLYQGANCDNEVTNRNDARFGAIPLISTFYEAENARLTNTSLVSHIGASNGSKVGNINFSDSEVNFNNINIWSGGTYTVLVRYDNGTGAVSDHIVTVNGVELDAPLQYPPTANWGRYLWAAFTCELNPGVNSISFRYNGTFAELDCIQIYKDDTDLSWQFALINRNSQLLLETPNSSMGDGIQLVQWSWTNARTQLWNVTEKDSSYLQFTNANSGRLMEIYEGSTEDGAIAVQYSLSGHYTQDWQMTPSSEGYQFMINRNSGKYLEIENNSTNVGAGAQQWGPTGFPCQEWTPTKEGMK